MCADGNLLAKIGAFTQNSFTVKFPVRSRITEVQILLLARHNPRVFEGI
jgi:hypothetical protein